MEKKRVRKIALIIAIAVVLGLVAAAVTSCGKPKVTGVKSLAAANIAAQSKVENYHVEGSVLMEISLDPEESQQIIGQIDPKLPVEIKMKADAGTETAHVTTDASANIFGKSIELQTAELYLDMKNKTSYTKTDKSGEWKKESYQKNRISFIEKSGGIAMVGKTVLENAIYTESDEFYTLSIPAEKAGELIDDLHPLDRVDLGIGDVRDITVKDGQIIYNVDKETLLVRSIELKDVDVRGKGTYEDVSVDLMFPIDAEFYFSRYDELEESEYALPADLTT